MNTKEKTCAERIDDQLARFEESAGELVADYESGEDDRFQNWNEYPLSIETRKVTTILMSWGGPSDFLKVEHDNEFIYSVEYHFQDWFDGAKRDIEEGSNVWRYAETIIETQRECGL